MGTRHKRAKEDWNKMCEGLRMTMMHGFIDGALSGIARRGGDPYNPNRREPLDVRSHIDLIVLSGNYNYLQLKEKLGELKVDESFIPAQRQPNYTQKAVRTFENGICLDCFYNPVDSFYPWCLLEVHQQNTPAMEYLKGFLVRLDQDLPMLNVSSVEYGNDIHCPDSKDVSEVSNIITRHLRIPYQRSIRNLTRKASDDTDEMEGGKKYGRMNSVFRIGNHFKIYERGEDPKRYDDYWSLDDCDRVRLEHTAKRPELMKHHIGTIGAFSKHPNFYEINRNLYHFVHFDGTDKLPRFYDDYNSDPENPGCFMAEQMYYRKKIKNINQYIHDTPRFAELLSAMRNSRIAYDEKWRRIL